MSDEPLNAAALRAHSSRAARAQFAQWQVRWQTAVLAAEGALSVEFWPPAPPDQLEAGGHRRVSPRSMRCSNGGAATGIATSSTRSRRWPKAAWSRRGEERK